MKYCHPHMNTQTPARTILLFLFPWKIFHSPRKELVWCIFCPFILRKKEMKKDEYFMWGKAGWHSQFFSPKYLPREIASSLSSFFFSQAKVPYLSKVERSLPFVGFEGRLEHSLERIWPKKTEDEVTTKTKTDVAHFGCCGFLHCHIKG